MHDGPLEDLAARFVLPAKSGVFLSKGEIIALARVSDASLRINERKRMLVDVLKSAQTPAAMCELLERLKAFCQVQVAEHEALVASYPVMRSLCAPWVERARATITSLDEVIEEISFAERAGPVG
jgi:hypothetical protein